MKARHLPLKPCVIYGGFDEAEKNKLKSISIRYGILPVCADTSIGNATVKSIINGRPDDTKEPVADAKFILINGAKLSAILDELKKAGVEIPLRAFVTLHSQEWPLNKLIAELERERKELGEE